MIYEFAMDRSGELLKLPDTSYDSPQDALEVVVKLKGKFAEPSSPR
jgi:hypothetical protein